MAKTLHFSRAGMIARWKPVHLGHARVLSALLSVSDRLVIGIGSSNKRDVFNPFSAAETRRMLELALGDRATEVEILDVPDLGDGPKWRAMVVEMLGPLDAFVTANDWVKRLLERDYAIVHPASLLAPEDQVRVSGTMVRELLARGGEWREWVPPAVASYLEEQGLRARFVREFGLETLAARLPRAD